MQVAVVDLRDRAVRQQLADAAVGELGGSLYVQFAGTASGQLAEAPLRLVLIMPIDSELTKDAEHLALALLGVDPSPRTIIAAIDTDIGEDPERDPRAKYRILPGEFARASDVRFLDLRSPMLTVGHPRSGSDRVGTGPRDPWVRTFIRDLVVQLQDRDVFDAVWQSIPRDQPATIGMRIASLGAGRERAVADLALRLGEELRPDREPEMGRPLPERWQVESGLLPDANVEIAGKRLIETPKSVQGLARVEHERPTKILARSPSAYNDAAQGQLHALTERPAALAALFEGAQGVASSGDGPRIDPIGAADLDEALGGVIFGDRVARQWEEGEDAADRIGGLLRLAAERQGDGLSAAVLALWLRNDADRVEPMGPAKVAELLRGPDQPWARLRMHIAGPWFARPDSRSWLGGSLDLSPASDKTDAADARKGPGPAQSKGKSPSEPADTERSAKAPAPTPIVSGPVPVPPPLGAVLGSPIWGHRSIGAIYVMVTTAVLILAGVQIWADATQTYLVDLGALGLSTAMATLVRILLYSFSALLIGYGVVSALAARSVRRWATSHRFDEVPEVLTSLETEAVRLAVMEVARCAIRREYARVARAAADTLEQASSKGSEVARAFGGETEELARATPLRSLPDLAPHRGLLGGSEHLTGTDAGGIYRVYPLYVGALRRLFARSLVDAIREKWPRVRGVFADETADLIATMASDALLNRLERVRDIGLRRGDLEEDGIDPADELATLLWADPMIRAGALRSLQVKPDEPMPILATPADTRLLDASKDSPLILAIPPTLVPLLETSAEESGARIVVTDALETATALRVFPFHAGLYDFVDVTRSADKIVS